MDEDHRISLAVRFSGAIRRYKEGLPAQENIFLGCLANFSISCKPRSVPFISQSYHSLDAYPDSCCIDYIMNFGRLLIIKY